MRSMFRSLLLAGLALGYGGVAVAQDAPATPGEACRLRIDTVTPNWSIRGIDPFAATPPVGQFDVLFVNEGKSLCRFRPIFQTDQAEFGLKKADGGVIRYSLLDETDGYDAGPAGGRTMVHAKYPVVEVQPSKQRLIRYKMVVEPAAPPSDGIFSQTLLFQAETPDGGILVQRPITVTAEFMSSAVMSLAGAFTHVNGMYDVDLGVLSDNMIKTPLALNVFSTRAFNLEVISSNGGKLVMKGTEWSIPYDFLINLKKVPFGSRYSYGSNISNGYTSTIFVLGFAVPDVQRKRAGRYSDVVTLSVSVN